MNKVVVKTVVTFSWLTNLFLRLCMALLSNNRNDNLLILFQSAVSPHANNSFVTALCIVDFDAQMFYYIQPIQIGSLFFNLPKRHTIILSISMKAATYFNLEIVCCFLNCSKIGFEAAKLDQGRINSV